MTKVAVITDTHFGARKGSKLFHDYFEKFYRDVFFPTLKKEGIDTVIHLGDAFDSRRGIEFNINKTVLFIGGIDELSFVDFTECFTVQNKGQCIKNCGFTSTI